MCPSPSQSSSTHQPAMLHRDNSMGPHDNNRSVLWRARGTVVCTISIRIAGKVLPFASFAVRRFARPAKNGQCIWTFLGRSRPHGERCERFQSRHPGTPRVAQGRMGHSCSREGAARRFVRSPPLARAAQNGPVLACFWAVFASCGGRGEGSSGRGIRVAGKVCCPPLRSPSVARPLALAAQKRPVLACFWAVFGRAAATAASGAKRQPSQHPGTPRVAQGWMGLSYSREGAARRFVRSPPLAARSGGPKTASFGLFLGRFRVLRWAR
ncbi:hypothetical protein OPV22_002484 [Ensete ventricosum]|uniref:Uncharacterized protein n=1 Tax=Ensete ventricosum TaxID=4639 RepID=A0AAV8RY73_ENSVE|nr:hypothetical protein OPV22_002484 [Ensete ventricosum]